MKSCDSSYSVEINSVDKGKWSNIISSFDDANIYQTWSYGAIRYGESKLEHLLVKKDNEFIGAAQSWIFKIPFLKAGIAYVKYGPLWQLRGRSYNPEHFRQIVRALKDEYVAKRGLLLRIMPYYVNGNDPRLHVLMEIEGFKPRPSYSQYRTIVIDLSYSINDLLCALKRNWRYNLNRAKKNNLLIIEGADDKLFIPFIKLYQETLERKKFAEFLSIKQMRKIQGDLPDIFKMRIMLCHLGPTPVAGLVVSCIGKTAIALFAATGFNGLNLGASHLLHWRFIELLKEKGFQTYDLCGINPKQNPGCYRFKSELSGKFGKDIVLPEFEVYQNITSLTVVRLGDMLRRVYRKLKEAKAKNS